MFPNGYDERTKMRQRKCKQDLRSCGSKGGGDHLYVCDLLCVCGGEKYDLKLVEKPERDVVEPYHLVAKMLVICIRILHNTSQ